MKASALFLFSAIVGMAADLRVGIVGTDTSHVIAFVKILNDPKNPDYQPGAKIVAAYKGGSQDLESSKNRVEGYAKELTEKWGVEIVPDIKTLCEKVDAILLESVDGRVHLAQAKEIFKHKKPVFIDKPLAADRADALAIEKLAKANGVKWFTSSSLRWSDGILDAKDAKAVVVWGPGPMDPTHKLDMTWYGIHAVEMLYAMMGTGCVEVTRVASGDDVVVGKWKDGRTGTVHLLRPYGDFGAMLFKEKTVVQGPAKVKVNYAPMLGQIVKFFQTGQSPVPMDQTMEMFAFMEAAQKSKEQGGKPVKLQ
jgi:hypothetical protein